MNDKILKTLIKSMLGLWLVSWIIGLLVAISALTMPVLSGLLLFGASSGVVLMPPFLIGILALIKVFGRYGELMISHYTIFGQLKNLRVMLFDNFIKFGSKKDFSSSILQHRFIKNVDILNEFVLRFITPMLVMAVSVIIGVAVLGFFGQFWAVFGVLLAVLVVLAGIYLAKPQVIQQSDLTDKRSTVLQDAMPVLTHLVIWGKWTDICQKSMHTSKMLDDSDKKSQGDTLLVVLLVQWILAAVVLSVVLGTYQNSTPLATIVCVLVVFGLYEPIISLASQRTSLGRSALAQNHLNGLISNTATANEPLPAQFYIQSQNLLVGHNNTASIAIDDFSIHRGTPLVIMGVSGGGKSTLMQTIAGEILPIQGDVLVISQNAKSLQNIDKSDIGFLGQQVDIFDQSLRVNLSFGQDIDDDSLYLALQKVNLDTWAKKLPKGLDTPLGEYGQAISGGQARRIALARLLLLPKKILLLDEPFAGLDKPNRDKLWQTLKSHQKNGMLVVISHHKDLDLTDCQVVVV